MHKSRCTVDRTIECHIRCWASAAASRVIQPRQPQANADRITVTRRSALLLATTLLHGGLQSSVAHARQVAQPLPPKCDEIDAWWAQQTDLVQNQLGVGFQARLAWWSSSAELPAGVIGDPAKDFKSSGRFGDNHCGTFLEGQEKPYEICPQPGCLPADETAQLCCRHFAYLLPYSPSARTERNKVSTVIASPRMIALPDGNWKAMLMHELGHCIDVHVYGSRYRLLDHAVEDSAVAAVLDDINNNVVDFEERADAFGNALLSDPVGAPLCYNPQTLIQTLVPGGQCAGSGEAGDVRPMAHYTHDLLAGFAPKR